MEGHLITLAPERSYRVVARSFADTEASRASWQTLDAAASEADLSALHVGSRDGSRHLLVLVGPEADVERWLPTVDGEPYDLPEDFARACAMRRVRAGAEGVDRGHYGTGVDLTPGGELAGSIATERSLIDGERRKRAGA